MRQVNDIKDVNIVLRELIDFKDSFLKNRDMKGLKLVNCADGTDPGDYITLRQLPDIPTIGKEEDQFYTISFSTTGPIVVGTAISAPFIVGKGREGMPYAVITSATVAPTSADMFVNITINGNQILVADLKLPMGISGPVASSNFVYGTDTGEGVFKLGYQTKVLPTCSADGGASLVVIQLVVKRVKRSLIGK